MHIVSVCALVSNPKGEVLLIRHPRRGWEVPGGQVDEDESLLEALQREIFEETGVTASISALSGIYSNIIPPPKLIFAFFGRWLSGELITSPESVEVEWVARQAALARITQPAIHARVKDLLEYNGKVRYRVYRTDPYELLAVSNL